MKIQLIDAPKKLKIYLEYIGNKKKFELVTTSLENLVGFANESHENEVLFCGKWDSKLHTLDSSFQAAIFIYLSEDAIPLELQEDPRGWELLSLKANWKKSFLRILNLPGIFSEEQEHSGFIYSEYSRMISMSAMSSQNGMIICDKNRRIEWVNPAFTELSGYTLSEVIGKIPGQVLQGEGTDQKDIEALRKKLQSGEPFYQEILNYRKDGLSYWVELHITPVLNERGEIERYIGIENIIDERKELEQKYHQNQKELNSILLAMSEGVVLQNTQGEIIFANPAAIEILGLSLEQMMGLESMDPRWGAVHEDGSPFPGDTHPAMVTLKTGEALRNVVMGVDKPDGSRTWISINSEPLKDEGEVSGVVTTFHNRTEEKVYQQSLQTEREMFSRGPVVTFVWGASDGWPVEFVSANVASLLGYSADEILVPDFEYSALVHPDDVERVVQEVQMHLDNKSDEFEQSYRLKQKDGQYCWVYDFTMPQYDESGKVVKIRGYMFDQSAIKEVQNALNIERERLKMIVEGTNLGTWEWNVQTGETRFNERWAEIVGYKLDELQPISIDTWMKFAHPEDLEESGRLLQDHWDGKTKFYEMESRMTHRDGHEIWVLDRGKVWEWTEDGKPLWMYGTHFEITERKQFEEQLRDSNAILEDQSSQMAAMAAEAEMANAAKSEFLANMSHEIRTPLAGVIGMSELLLESSLNAEQRSWIDTVHSSGRHLLELINDILDFSKIEAGKVELEIIDFNLTDLVDEVMMLTTTRVKNKDLELLALVHPAVPEVVQGDPIRLKQILVNLVGNAIKFTQFGYVELYVEPVKNDVSKLCFYVNDTGIGIPKEKQQIIFEKFNQVDASTTRKYGGTGLGLAISNQLVHLMNSKLQLRSQVGRGSSFYFEISSGRHSGERDLMLEDVYWHMPESQIGRLLYRRLTLWGANIKKIQEGCMSDRIPQIANHAGNHLILCHEKFLWDEVKSKENKNINFKLADFQNLKVAALQSRFKKEEGVCDHCEGIVYIQKPISCRLILSLMHAEEINSENILTSKQKDQYNLDVKAEVLVVEDNAVNQTLIQAMLSKFGITPKIATNGREALRELETNDYDLVFMDVQMPIMDGYEATEVIRSGNRNIPVNIPIVAMTANAMEGDKEKCLSQGMDDYLSKPVELHDLRQILLKWGILILANDEILPAETHSEGEEMSEEIVFDYQQILDRVVGDVELAQVVLKQYLDDMPMQLEVLENCLSQSEINMPDSIRAAHTAKGAAANVGAERLSALYKSIEFALKDNQIQKLDSLLDKVEPLSMETKLQILKSLEENA